MVSVRNTSVFRALGICSFNIAALAHITGSEIAGIRDEGLYFRWTPHPVIATFRDNKDYIRGPDIFLLYQYYKVGGLLTYAVIHVLKPGSHLRHWKPATVGYTVVMPLMERRVS